MASIRKVDCACPKAKKATCRHKPWKVRYRGPGGRVGKQLEASFKLKSQADEFAAKVERDKQVGTYIDPKQTGRLFSDVWEEWLAAGTREPSTLASYGSTYRNHLAPVFGWRAIGSITSKDIADWKRDQDERYAASTAHHRMVVLKTIFRYAHEMEIIPRNPALSQRQRGRATPIARQVKPTEIPTTGQVEDIFEAMWGPLKASVWIQAGSGARVGESLAVSRTSLGAVPGMLKLWQQLHTHGTNHGKGRGVGFKDELKWSREARMTPLSYTVQQAVDRHLEEYGSWGEHGWLFQSPKFADQPISFKSYADHWTKALKKAGLEGSGFTPKSLRHYFASVCIAGGVPLYEVAQWMGHKSTRVTEATYAHLLADAPNRTMDAVEVAILEHARTVMAERPVLTAV
ncbi:tyrosine-type recombinase/integrase [Streptomyces pseudogriseolus]|uniref:tyrosine-type recombinase/integrase n=1 Tax=Streptomyces pseudogriseolus TaxID=36817 RepID=UPI003FA30D08